MQEKTSKAPLWWAVPAAFGLMTLLWVPAAIGLVLLVNFLFWEVPSLDYQSYLFWVRLGLVAAAVDAYNRLRAYYAD